MDVDVMTMPREKAREAFDTYKTYLKERHDDELEALMGAYKQMANGNGVIDVQAAIHDTGVDEKGQPKLALVRAHAKEVFYRRSSDGSVRFSEDRSPDIRARFSVRDLPPDTLGRYVWEDTWSRTRPNGIMESGRAIVPLVPAQFRPKFGLHNYHILFEAVWVKKPPVDPILLKHMGGHLYAVLAEWDLTPIEQAVLKGRL